MATFFIYFSHAEKQMNTDTQTGTK